MRVDCPCCGCVAESPASEALWLTFNGEIYNFLELRRELRSNGHRFTSHTDSEVLLHLYSEEGPEMFRRLNGIFALAIYDGRPTARGRIQPGDLLLARDGLGVKPLYYAQAPGGFLFASELKALLACHRLSREVDLDALNQYLAFNWCCAPGTPIKAIRRFQPGKAMIVRRGSIAAQWSHYELPYGRPPFTAQQPELVRELAVRLEEAVERQMMADVPVGAFLSGGLDSSAVVAMMKRRQPELRPKCYTIGFEAGTQVEGNQQDLPFARRVAEQLDVDLQVVTVGPDMIEHLGRMLYFLDEPQSDPAPINALLIAEQARRDGIKVLMSGAGGDDIFSGYRRHVALLAERYWSLLPTFVRRCAAAAARSVAGGCCPAGSMARPSVRRLAKMLSLCDLGADLRLAGHFQWSAQTLRFPLFSRAAAAQLDGGDASAPLLRSLQRIPHEPDALNRLLYLEARHFLADHNLNYVDKVSMANGVEVRVPLLDLELVDFATRIPSHMKQHGRTGKAIFKKSMEPFLPRDVIYRSKTGFGAPLRQWLRCELRDLVEDVLSPAALLRRGIFDPLAVRRLIQLDRAGRVDAAYTIFGLMLIELWFRMFLDGEAVRAGSTPAQLCFEAA